MLRKPKAAPPQFEAILALGLFLSFFSPWLRSMGNAVSAPEIRDLLSGPHRFLSSFHAGARISADYRLSLFLWAVPIAAAGILIAIASRRYRNWMAAAAGGLAVVAFAFLRHEVEAFPFHTLAWGAYLALILGIALLACSLGRILSR
jgi:hypothetical protein